MKRLHILRKRDIKSSCLACFSSLSELLECQHILKTLSWNSTVITSVFNLNSVNFLFLC